MWDDSAHSAKYTWRERLPLKRSDPVYSTHRKSVENLMQTGTGPAAILSCVCIQSATLPRGASRDGKLIWQVTCTAYGYAFETAWLSSSVVVARGYSDRAGNGFRTGERGGRLSVAVPVQGGHPV